MCRAGPPGAAVRLEGARGSLSAAGRETPFVRNSTETRSEWRPCRRVTPGHRLRAAGTEREAHGGGRVCTLLPAGTVVGGGGGGGCHKAGVCAQRGQRGRLPRGRLCVHAAESQGGGRAGGQRGHRAQRGAHVCIEMLCVSALGSRFPGGARALQRRGLSQHPAPGPRSPPSTSLARPPNATPCEPGRASGQDARRAGRAEPRDLSPRERDTLQVGKAQRPTRRGGLRPRDTPCPLRPRPAVLWPAARGRHPAAPERPAALGARAAGAQAFGVPCGGTGCVCVRPPPRPAPAVRSCSCGSRETLGYKQRGRPGPRRAWLLVVRPQ